MLSPFHIKTCLCLFIGALFILIHFSGYTQDKIEQIWLDETGSDEEKLTQIDDYVWGNYIATYSDSGLFYAEKMCSLARESNLPLYVANAQNMCGIALYQNMEYDSAIAVYNRNILYTRANGLHKKSADYSVNLGLVHLERNSYFEAARLMETALYYYREQRDTVSVLETLENLGSVYMGIDEFEVALNYFNQAQEFSEQFNLQGHVAGNLNNKGVIFKSLNQFNRALEHYQSSLAIYREQENVFRICQGLNNIGSCFMAMRDDPNIEIDANDCLDSSKKYLLESLYLARANKYDKNEISIMNNLADVHFLRGNIDSAIFYGERSVALIKDHGVFSSLRTPTRVLHGCYKSQGRINEAMAMLELNNEVRDSINGSVERVQLIKLKYDHDYQIQRLRDSVRYDELQRIQEIEISSQRSVIKANRMLNYVLLLALLITVVFGIILYRNNMAKKKINGIINRQRKELVQRVNEREAILKEIHHRVKNNMQVVSSLLRLHMAGVEDEKMQKILEDCQNRIAIMSSIHERMYKTKDFKNLSLHDYLLGLISEITVFHDPDRKVKLDFLVPDVHFAIEEILPLGLISHEIISNSYKHAFKSNIEAGVITFHLSQMETNNYQLIIGDNGAGNVSFPNSDSSSLGLTLIDIFVDQLDGKMDVSTENGVIYTINFSVNKD